MLSSQHYTPQSIIFPVSAAMLRNIKEYDTALESYSKPLLTQVKYKMTPKNEV
ncbi:hypothetical protein ACFKHW_40485 (plasmid) [Bradyrhizobium lupini]|uniref:hypothetical protein n=1 Tax=Rhizobium lupini TaxID=136996 RepID=UPI00366DF1FA